jgi:hypothetical protein
MNATVIILCIAGFALHFLGRYGEFLRTGEKIGPLVYLAQDWPGWLSAAIGTAVTLALLPEVGPLIGISTGNLGAVLAGYVGSSLSAKLPALMTGKGVR